MATRFHAAAACACAAGMGVLARNGSATIGLVLGHVIAHELGHLLLRRSTHSAAGLMKATLDLQLAQQGRLLFTPDEAQTIRAAIARDAERQ